MSIGLKTKKLGDMTEKELEQKIAHTVAESLFQLAGEIGKINEKILFLTENKVSPH